MEDTSASDCLLNNLQTLPTMSYLLYSELFLMPFFAFYEDSLKMGVTLKVFALSHVFVVEFLYLKNGYFERNIVNATSA